MILQKQQIPGQNLARELLQHLSLNPRAFCCHVVGDLPTSEASILPRTELELELLQIQEYMRVSYLPFQREIQIIKIVTDMPFANSRGRSL